MKSVLLTQFDSYLVRRADRREEAAERRARTATRDRDTAESRHDRASQGLENRRNVEASMVT
jgi:hypothetical protein